jgi:hypothetical protein
MVYRHTVDVHREQRLHALSRAETLPEVGLIAPYTPEIDGFTQQAQRLSAPRTTLPTAPPQTLPRFGDPPADHYLVPPDAFARTYNPPNVTEPWQVVIDHQQVLQ